ncbi:MAG: LysM peptidoglycan-binding domain-containing protein [Lutibacter sp.]|nr:LysM peptidoglycan-binding domain-containing protein [Lutibacter sp.]
MKRITLILVSLILFSCGTMAQQKKYVSYTVKNGETVKSIAKTYHITSKELLQLNPDISKNLAPNTVIIVPNLNYGKQEVKQEVKAVNGDKKLYFVLPKDTLYGISKMFGITIEQLQAANPQIADGLKPGMELVIPKPGSTEINPNDTITYVLHTVVKDDTMYNLSNRFQVSQSELLRLNPELSEGLKLGMTLKIKPIQNGKRDHSASNETKVGIENNVKVKRGALNENFNFSKEIKLVIMLPYNLNKSSDSTKSDNFGKSNSLLNIVTDFHLGATMAIDSLRNRGLNVKVKFIDSENSTQKLQAVINRNDLKNADAVIGPLYFDNAVWLSKHIEAPVVVPFYSKNQSSNSANNLVKAVPEDQLLQSELLRYLEKNFQGENIVVINDGKSDSQTKLWQVVNKLKTFNNVKNISVVKSEYGYISGAKISEKLTKSANNWVFLVSDEMVTTASAINSLKSLADSFQITLIALDKGKNFDTVDNNLLGKMNFMYPSIDFLDVDDAKLNNFYKTYQDKNFAIPSKYALKGFDITYDVLARITTMGTLEQGLKAGKSVRFSTLFNYDRDMLGSFENHGVFIVQYNKSLTPVILE